MNWITKALRFGEKIKKVLKKRPSKEDIENSDWTSCCKGPILKKELEENLWVCNSCGKHHRINCLQRFDIIFGKNAYEILDTPIPAEDPLEWVDTKSYKERLIQLEAVKYVDEIIKYETEEELYQLLKLLRPDVRILGSDYEDGRYFTGMELNIPIYYHERYHNYSSTNIRKKINEI